MSNCISKKLRCLGATLAASATLYGSHQLLTAGEAIQFSPSKGKAEPGAPNNKLPKEKLSNLDRLPSSNPLDAANLARPAGDDPRRPKTKEETRRKLKELEDKNWAAVESGQLQEEEDEKTSMGVREYDIEKGGKEKSASDIWLERRSGDNARFQGNPRSRGTAARGPSQSRPQPARESDDSDSGLKISIVGGQTGSQTVGAPSAGEPKLNNILGPGATSGGLWDAFSGANSDQSRRGDLGLRSIEAPAGTRPSSLGGGDSLGFGRDLSAKSALSASPSLLEAPKSQPSTSFAPPASGSGFGLSGSRYSSPAFNDANLGSRSGFGSAPPTSLQPQNNSTPGASRDAFAPPTRPSSGR
jgi:hypothetical protein